MTPIALEDICWHTPSIQSPKKPAARLLLNDLIAPGFWAESNHPDVPILSILLSGLWKRKRIDSPRHPSTQCTSRSLLSSTEQCMLSQNEVAWRIRAEQRVADPEVTSLIQAQSFFSFISLAFWVDFSKRRFQKRST